MGHSNGALLHLLGGCLAMPRDSHRGDALISFNNKCGSLERIMTDTCDMC